MPVRSALVTGVLASLLAATPAVALNDSAGEDQVAFPSYGEPAAQVLDAGDADGDGVGDVATTFPPATGVDGQAHVVFGRREGGVAGPTELAARGYRIDGVRGAAAPVGDVDGDGRADLAVPQADGLTVVFGRPRTGVVAAGDPRADGYVVTGAGPLIGYWGAGSRRPAVVGLGDLDGNGRADLVVSDESVIRIVYTPDAPAGATVDVADPGARVGVVRDPGGVHMAALGDVDRDGRRELGVIQRDGGRILGLSVPRAGEDLDAQQAVEQGRAFELRGASGRVSSLEAAGDHDGDGIEDLALILAGFDRYGMVAFALPLGARRDLGAPEAGYRVDGAWDPLIAIGDQDGDARPDLAYGPFARLSTGPVLHFTDDDFFYSGGNTMWIAGTTADRDGDGRRELIVAEHVPDGAGGRRTRYGVNDSGRVLVHAATVDAAPPATPCEPVRFSATWADAPYSAAAAAAEARMQVEIRPAGGGTGEIVGAKGVRLGGPGPFVLSVDAPTLGPVFTRGGTYDYRVQLVQAHGLQTSGPWRRISLPGSRIGPPPVCGSGGARAARDRRRPVLQLATPRRARAARGWRVLRGRATDGAGGSGVERVEVGLVRRVATRCRRFDGRRFARPAGCRRARRGRVAVVVRRGRWRLRVRGVVRGRYELRLRAADRAGNATAAPVRRLRLR